MTAEGQYTKKEHKVAARKAFDAGVYLTLECIVRIERNMRENEDFWDRLYVTESDKLTF